MDSQVPEAQVGLGPPEVPWRCPRDTGEVKGTGLASDSSSH